MDFIFTLYAFLCSKAAKLSSLSVEENSRSFVLYQLPSRYSNHCNDLPQVDVTDLLFSVDKPVVLHSLNLFGEPEKDYKFTIFVAKVCVCVCTCTRECVCVCTCTHTYVHLCTSVYLCVYTSMCVCLFVCA